MRDEIIREMEVALKEGQFEVYLQPQCNIHSGVPIGAEALIRWNHPKKGMIAPKEFLSISEKNGFIQKLDAYVWEQVCRLLHRWKEEGRVFHPLSVNISKRNLCNSKVCDKLIALAEEYEIAPELLSIEVAEHAYQENQEKQEEMLERLQRYGFTVLMDDFGGGEASFDILKDSVVDMLKLDLRLISREETPGQRGNRINCVGRMAKWLNLSMIAEGVETRRQVDYLNSIGCYVAQGYYYAKPMPIADYEVYLEAMTEKKLVHWN